MASLCQSQQRCVKASIACQWQLAEAQDQLCGLELHGSESAEQEHARALASSTELSQIEQEWMHKERMLGRSPTLCPEASRDVFDKVRDKGRNVKGSSNILFITPVFFIFRVS